MNRFIAITIIAITIPSCTSAEAPTADEVSVREAPDPPSVAISGEVESPINIGKILWGCFDAVDTLGAPTLLDYTDEAPDGDDQQPAQLCVSWSAHSDVADCVRIGLISAGGEATPIEEP